MCPPRAPNSSLVRPLSVPPLRSGVARRASHAPVPVREGVPDVVAHEVVVAV